MLAAAVRGGADTLVTFNRKDFPPESTDDHGNQGRSPRPLLGALAGREPERRARRPRTRYRCSAQACADGALRGFLASLTPTVPMFANLAADATGSPLAPTSPVPALVSADEGEAVAAFGEPGDFTNPAHVAFDWWAGILEDLDLARALTYDASAWDDY